MRHLDIITCLWLSAQWAALVRDGYSTAVVSDDRVAVMWKGYAARDHVRNVMGAPVNG